jgi:hypothetical protein
VAATCRAQQQIPFDLFHLRKQCKKLIRTVSSDPGCELTAPDYYRMKQLKVHLGKNFEHIGFFLFAGDGT